MIRRGMFTCPICLSLSAGSDALLVPVPDDAPTRICWPCAKAVELAVQRAEQGDEERLL